MLTTTTIMTTFWMMMMIMWMNMRLRTEGGRRNKSLEDEALEVDGSRPVQIIIGKFTLIIIHVKIIDKILKQNSVHHE